MKEMKIFRTERIKIYPDDRQSIHDVKSIINKKQDLKVVTANVLENEKAFVFTVNRELENCPDTFK